MITSFTKCKQRHKSIHCHISWQFADSKRLTLFTFIKTNRLYKVIPCSAGASLILWSCTALHCIHHLLGWKEAPALLTAGYKTDSIQQMFNAAYNHCLPTLLSWSVWDREKKIASWIWSGGGGTLNWFRSANCCWSVGLKSLGDTLSAGRPTDLYLNLAIPKACQIPPGGSDYVLYRETGVKHYGCFGLITRAWQSWAAAWASECSKGDEKETLNEWQMVA